jgi:type II secretory pathway component PulK
VKGRRRKQNDGVALILTLLFVVLLTVLVVEFAYEAQVEASYALNSENEFQAKLAARSAVYNGIGILETDRLETELAASEGGTAYADSRQSSWAQPGSFEPLNDAVMRTTISDEFGKINLNALVYYVGGDQPTIRENIQVALEEFFQTRDEGVDAKALVDSLIDWMDEDDDTYDDGAETEFYEKSENPYPCKNGPMDSIEELLLIKGMTPELYFGSQNVEPPQLPLSEYLTVHGDWLGRINPNTVYVDYDSGISDVLEAMAVGWEESNMGTIIDTEELLAGVIDFETGQPYNEVNELAPYVDFSNLNSTVEDDSADNTTGRRRTSSQTSQRQQNQQQQQEAAALKRMFTVFSHIFRIQGDALLDDILVRNEAYVFRVPQDDTYEFPDDGAADAQLVGEALIQNRPQEFYRILEWKVIQ